MGEHARTGRSAPARGIFSRVCQAFVIGITAVAGLAVPTLAQEAEPDLCLAVVCPRLDDCHQWGVCDPGSGSCFSPLMPDGSPCNDGNAATVNDVCTAGDCAGTWDLCFGFACRVLDDCHQAGVCDPATGLCSDPAQPDGTRCNDGNQATVDDVCTGGVCAGVFDLCFAVACRSLDDCHDAGVCDPDTGECSDPVKPDGTPCYDYNRATVDDVCTDGVCAGRFDLCPDVLCVPPDDCHTSTCEPTTGDCTAEEKPDGAPCDDGDPDTAQDACEAGVCVGIDDLCADVDCEPLDQCHEAVCDPSTGGCLDRPRPDGSPCDDGWEGTDPDACVSGLCTGESLYAHSGLLPPVVAAPGVNRKSAGSAVALKFSLGGDFGLAILVVGFPASAAMDCGSDEEFDAGDPTVSAGGGGLSYDPASDVYSYVWKTDRSWSGTCRQLVVQLNDGVVYRANFSFR